MVTLLAAAPPAFRTERGIMVFILGRCRNCYLIHMVFSVESAELHQENKMKHVRSEGIYFNTEARKRLN